MTFARTIAAAVALICVCAAPALAQDGGAEPRTMTLMELLRGKKNAEPEKAETTRAAAARPADPAASGSAISENTGELRSTEVKRTGFLGLRVEPRMLPETRALDGALERRASKARFKVKPDFEPQSVAFSGYPRGTIVIDTGARYLYLVESASSARRYAIAVGREGLEFKGEATVGDKQEWPRWFPTKAMQEREPRKYARYAEGMNGGPDNPLGARAIYLHQGKRDTHVRIHGTNAPETVGTNSSNGCFRMVNEHVMDLYGRVKVGTKVVVL